MRSIKPTAIVDVGSNSIRLVVYAGAARAPHPIFNEKVLAGLGEGVGETGLISPDSWQTAISVLKRYRLLLRHMGARQTRMVATAAVRDARNGPEFVEEIGRLGIDCRVIGAEEEAWLAGEGVLSAIPDADGIVGDLGGGSLELVEVSGGLAGRGISLPLGVLRAKATADGEKEAGNLLRRKLAESGLAERGEGRTLYLVGGSWRALARIDMAVTGYPLPMIHAYAFAPNRIGELRQAIVGPELDWAKSVAPARLATTPVAAMLLDKLVQQIRPCELVVSSFGIREGLLFSQLGGTVRKQDPLIAAARYAGGAERRFGEHGDILDAWIGTLFDDGPARSRIRLASCLLADLAWQATPEFRADRSVETALHGNWTGVTAAERVMMAQALSSCFGREKLPDQRLAGLCSEDDLRRAAEWGVAIRLAQRLSAGAGSVLRQTAVSIDDGAVKLSLPRSQADLVADPVQRRLRRLAKELGLEPRVVLR